MNLNKKLVIIGNEKASKNENKFYCDNIINKSISEGLNNNFEVTLVLRKSVVARSHQINVKEIKLASNIFTFLFNIFKTFNHKETNYFLKSITPYTFFAYLLLIIFKKKIFVYIESNGYEEYRAILGFFGPLIYHFMYALMTFKSSIITCQKKLVKKKKSDLVFPSELDNNWFQNITKSLIDKPRLLYVGRIKIEKGIFSLLKIFEEMTNNVELSIVGVEKTEVLKLSNSKIKFIGSGYIPSELIKIYDNHNILILPSFTEAHPKVIDESLARARPVIIFEEINHIIQNRYGIFISKRNVQSLSETIKFIMNNYSNIQENMKKNKLPTKQEFFLQMEKILG